VDQAERKHLNEMLARLKDGDRDAVHPVFDRLHPLLRRFCGRHLRPEEAEDAAQEALVKLFAQAARYDPSRDGVAWALTLAAFEVRTVRRRAQRRREDAIEPATRDGHPDPHPTPEAQAIASSQEAWLEDVLGSLSPADADTLRAYAQDERPAGVAAATFRKRVERGLLRVRRLLGLSSAPRPEETLENRSRR
jgi:RNA polymerase sigma-70 factor (ECF subfamily)